MTQSGKQDIASTAVSAPPVNPKNKHLLVRQNSLTKQLKALEQQFSKEDESLKKKKELQEKVQRLINKQIAGQKVR